ncbi:unnamed protein product [Closterium sp. Yama58-4]|nr:unnamed protein product [Closterium sp. Yama58-4]
MPIGAPVAIEPRGSVGGSRGDSHANVHVHVPRADSRLLSHVAFEAADDLDLALQSLHARLKPLLASDSEGDVHSQLQEMVSEGAQQHADVVNGLLYAILTASHKTGPPPSPSSHTVPAAAVRLFGILCSVTRDHHTSLLATLQRLASDKWSKLQDHVRSQVIWILRQLVQQAVQEAETLFLCLFRQVSGGDLSVGNVWLARQLLDVLRTNTQWLYTLPSLLALSLYTFLRLLPDHAVSKAPAVVELKQQEVAFCTQLIRERFQDCLVIGRDLVRLLQDVALIPEFEPIWRDLVHRPETMGAPGFSDLAQLYVVRTPTRFITSRVTPEMESQLRFLLAHVRMGHQRRYQTWFATRFLAAPESESLVADLIRFVCCSVHPTNQVLQSDVVPRWAIVGWLLKCCRSCHMEANAKLALFYDWLFFMPKTDNIMNIEPAMLCMVHSLPKYAIMTNSLLEFLFLLLDHYDVAHRDLILRGISASVDILVGKGVVPSLEPLATSGFIPTKLRERLQTLFPAYCRLDASPHRYLPPSPLHDPHHAERAAAAVIPGGAGGAGGRGGQARGSGALAKSPSPSPPHLAAERDSMGNIVGGGAGIRAAEEQRGKEGQVAETGEGGAAGVGTSRPVGGSVASAAAGKGAVDASGSTDAARGGEDAEMGEASAAGEDQVGGKGPGGAEKRGKSAEGAEMESGERGGGEGEMAEGGRGKRERKRKREENEEGEEEAMERGEVEAGEVEGGEVVEEEEKGEQSEEREGMDEEMKAIEGMVRGMEEAAAAGDGAKVIEGFKAFLVALRGECEREAEGKAQGNLHGELEGGQEKEKEGKGEAGRTAGRTREGRHVVREEQQHEEVAGKERALISTRVSQCLAKVGFPLFPSLASLSPNRLNELLLSLPPLPATEGVSRDDITGDGASVNDSSTGPGRGASGDGASGDGASGNGSSTGKEASGRGASEDGAAGNGVAAGAVAGTPYPFEGAALLSWTSTLMVLHEYVLQNELLREWRVGSGEKGEENKGEQREEANAMDLTGGEEGQGSGKGKEGGEEEQDGEGSDKKKGEYGGGDLNFLLPVEELLISWHHMGKPVTAWLLCVGAAAAEKEQLSAADALAAAAAARVRNESEDTPPGLEVASGREESGRQRGVARVTNDREDTQPGPEFASGREESGRQRGGSREKPAAECLGQQGGKEGLADGGTGVRAEVVFGLYERLVGLCWGRDEEGSNGEEDAREEEG